MTITSTVNRISHAGDGVTTTPFSFPYLFFADGDLTVILRVDATGVETTQVLTTDYTVTGAGTTTGFISMTTAPAVGETLVILREVAATQGTDYRAGDPFPAETHEQALDRLTMLVQQLLETDDRAITLPKSSSLTPTMPEPGAGEVIGWNSGGTDLTTYQLADFISTFDTVLTALADNDMLRWDAGNNRWENVTPAGLLTILGFSAFVITTIGAANQNAFLDVVGAIKQGKHAIPIVAASMRPTVSNGCAPLASVETTADRPDMYVLDFDNSADEHAQFQIPMPPSWDEGTITYRVYWAAGSAANDGVAWALQGVAVSDNETIDVAYGTAVVVNDVAQGAVEELYISPESSAVTIAGTPSAGDMVIFRIFRDVSDADDDLSADARLLAVQIFYTVDARDDA